MAKLLIKLLTDQVTDMIAIIKLQSNRMYM